MPTQQPLNDRVPIVNEDGTPSQYFIRLLREAGIVSDTKAGSDDVADKFKALTLKSLGDVDITTVTPLNTQALAYNSATSKWEPKTVSGGGGGGGASASVSFYWNGTSVVITSSNNVASVVRTSQGQYTVNFATPFANTFYTFAGHGKFLAAGDQNGGYFVMNRSAPKTASSCGFFYLDTLGNNGRDPVATETDGSATLVFFGV